MVDSWLLYVVFLGPIPGVSVLQLSGGVESGVVLHPQAGLSVPEGVAPNPDQHFGLPRSMLVVYVHGLSLDLYGHLFGSSQLVDYLTIVQ